MSNESIVLISLLTALVSAIAAAISAYYSKKYSDCDKATFICTCEIEDIHSDRTHIIGSGITLILENIGRETTEINEISYVIRFQKIDKKIYIRHKPKFIMAPPKQKIHFKFLIDFNKDYSPEGFDITNPEEVFIELIIHHRGRVFKSLFFFPKLSKDKFYLQYKPDQLYFISSN